MKKHIAFSLAALLAAAPVLAGTPYVGVDAGRTTLSEADVSGNGAGVYGGYRFNDSFALEAGYRRLFSETVTELGVPVKIKGSALQASLVGYLPVAQDLSLFGRLGVNRLKAEASAFGNRASDSETKAYWGVGAEYAVTPSTALRLEFQKPDSDARTVSLGVKVSF
jgi:OOP family OmpA-OmpF porin